MSDRSLQDRIASDLKDAMRAQDDVRRRTLRSLRSALMKEEIDQREGGEGELTKQQELSVLQKAAKQRRESLEQFEEAGREDLAQKEREELAVIEEYLPSQLSDDALHETIEAIIDEVGAESMADMGRVMGRAMGELRGRADGNRVRKAVESILRD
ncbi:MAG: GatB/YqeY domain-containing protein [Bacteroidetes bacterium]|jgi:uncharacterized protein YqeY|nr:GatB/YqeY domain-containing protein [Bacteroidota bacterium]